MSLVQLSEKELIAKAIDISTQTWAGLAKAPKVEVPDESASFFNILTAEIKSGTIPRERGLTALALCSVCTFSIYEVRNEKNKIDAYAKNTTKLVDQLKLSDADKNSLKTIIADTVASATRDTGNQHNFNFVKDDDLALSDPIRRFRTAYLSFRENWELR